MTNAELIERLCDMALKKVDPETRAHLKTDSQVAKSKTLPLPEVAKKEATQLSQILEIKALHGASPQGLNYKNQLPGKSVSKISRYIPSTIK